MKILRFLFRIPVLWRVVMIVLTVASAAALLAVDVGLWRPWKWVQWLLIALMALFGTVEQARAVVGQFRHARDEFATALQDALDGTVHRVSKTTRYCAQSCCNDG